MSSTNKRPSYTSVDINLSDPKIHGQKLAYALNGILAGKQNNVLDVTLTVNATQTVLTDSRLTAFSHLSFMPKTTDASTAYKGTFFVSNQGKGTATINHAASSATDQTFTVQIAS